MGITIEQTQHVLLPVGEYPATVAEVEEAEGQFGPQLKFTFNLMGENTGASLTGWCSRSFNNRSRLYAWTQAIFGGKAIPPEWAFDSDKIMNRKVLLVVIKKASPDGTEFNRIDSVLPFKAQAKKPAPPPVPDDWEADEDES